MHTGKAIVAIPDDDVEQTRMTHPKVTDRQASLVAQVLHDGSSVEKAAKAIGANRSWAYTAMKKPHVQAYAQDLANVVLGCLGLRALATAGQLLNAKSDWLKADVARDLMDRANIGRDKVSVQAPTAKITINLG